MTRIILSGNETFTTASGGEYIGGSGNEVVQIAGNPNTPVFVDGNIERLELTGAISIYSFRINGNQVSVFSGNNEVARITVQDDTNGTVMAFADGGADLRLTGLNSATLGGQPVSTTPAPGSSIPASSMGSNFRTSNADKSFGGMPSGPVGPMPTPSAGQTFTLTNAVSGDSIISTANSDTFNGATGTFQSADRIIDPSSTDTDTLTVAIQTFDNTLRAGIQSVENININGNALSTGLNLDLVRGTKLLVLSTAFEGGTAIVDGVSADRASTITSGANVEILSVRTTEAGGGTANITTNGSVTVSAGTAAKTINVIGSTGDDSYVVNAGSATTAVNVVGNMGTDSFTVNLAGKPVSLNTDNSAIETLTLNSIGGANQVTLADADLIVTAAGKAVVSGNAALNLIGDLDALTGLTVEKTASAAFNMTSNAALTGAVLNKVAADQIELVFATGAVAGGITLNTGTTLRLGVANQTANTYNVDNAAGDLAKGTLKVEVAESQATTFTTGTKVGVLALSATAKDVAVTNITANAALDQIQLTGDKNLAITTLNYGADDVFSATGYTGALTILNTAAVKGVIFGGEASDSISISSALADTIVRGGNGADVITGGASRALIFGDAGNDTLTGGAGDDTVNGGADVDRIVGAAGADSITTGTGADIVRYSAAPGQNAGIANVDRITDFTAGTDKISIQNNGFSLFGGGSDFLAGVTLNQNATINLAAAQTIATAADLTAVFAGITAIGASTDGALQAKVVTVSAGVAAGTYVYINDATAGVSNADDMLINITGITGTLAAGDFVFSAT